MLLRFVLLNTNKNPNKKELYQYLVESCTQGTSTYVEKFVISTDGISTLQNLDIFDNSIRSPCNHEEADSRIIVHVFDAVKKGFKLVTIYFWCRCSCYLHWKVWVTIATWSLALPEFHSLNGCDQVSFFAGRGKTFWQTWKHVPEVTDSLIRIQGSIPTMAVDLFLVLSRVVVWSPSSLL